LVVPLGAKAKMTFSNQAFAQLSNGTYTVKITDISGAFWTHQITK